MTTPWILIALAALLYGSAAKAQYEDYVWVFGKNVGIGFDTITKKPDNIPIYVDCYEAATSISDSSGNLLLYLSQSPNDEMLNDHFMAIYGSDGRIVLNGDSIKCSYTANHGAVLIPYPGRKDSYFLFHVGYNSTQLIGLGCGFNLCYVIFYTIIEKNFAGEWVVVEKNKVISNNQMEESIGVVKHGNGRDYWVFCHKQRDSPWKPGTKQILKLLISPRGVTSYPLQEIGSQSMGSNIGYGHYVVSKSGTKIAYILYEEKKSTCLILIDVLEISIFWES